jgi:hypothetical protein
MMGEDVPYLIVFKVYKVGNGPDEFLREAERLHERLVTSGYLPLDEAVYPTGRNDADCTYVALVQGTKDDVPLLAGLVC